MVGCGLLPYWQLKHDSASQPLSSRYFIITMYLIQKTNTAGKLVGWVGNRALTLAPCFTSKVTISILAFLTATSRGLKISRFGSAPASNNISTASVFLFITAEYRAVLRRSSYIFDQSSDNFALTSYPALINVSRTSSLLRSAAKWRGLMPECLTLTVLVLGISMATMLRKMRKSHIYFWINTWIKKSIKPTFLTKTHMYCKGLI